MSEKIKKGLECCATNDENQCWHCPYVHEPNNSCLSLPKDALAYILELEEKCEKLDNALINVLQRQPTLVERAEKYAREEFAEKLKEKATKIVMTHNNIPVKTDYQISGNDIDNLLEEMEREGK